MTRAAQEAKAAEVTKTRTQKRAARTRQRLLDAALVLFSDRGIDATAVGDITEAADLGKGTFYRHFASKEEAVVALVEDSVARLVDRLRGAGKKADQLEEALKHMLTAHVEFFLNRRDEFLLLFQGRLLLKLRRDVGDELEEPYLRYLSEIEAQLAPFVAEPIEARKVRRVAYAMAGFVSGFLSFAMIGLSNDEIESSLLPLRRAFMAAVRTFLAGPPESVPASPARPVPGRNATKDPGAEQGHAYERKSAE